MEHFRPLLRHTQSLQQLLTCCYGVRDDNECIVINWRPLSRVSVVMPSALPAGRAVPYDAYSSDHLHEHPPPSSHPPHQHHHQQPAAAGGGSPSVRQRWYELSDGAVTPPDDCSSSSHRGDFVNHVTAAMPLPHGVTAAKRRPLGCRLTANICVDMLLIASLAVSAYFLRLRHLLPPPRVGGVTS